MVYFNTTMLFKKRSVRFFIAEICAGNSEAIQSKPCYPSLAWLKCGKNIGGQM
jgi:hypothetical protein